MFRSPPMLASLVFFSFLSAVGTAYSQTVPVSADAYTVSTTPTANFGTSSTVRVRSTSHAGYFFFDLGSLGSGDVQSATLRIRVQRLITGTGSVAVHEVLGPWSESGLTFNDAPAFSALPETTFPVVPSNEGAFVEVDVTSLVAGWVTTPSSNFGLTLRPPATGIAVEFNARESGFPAELVVQLGDVTKPNVVTVEISGGDYANPIDAMNESDSWCDTAMLAANASCQLLIGPGTFLLLESLRLPAQFDVIGAGKSGTRRTELVTAPGIESAIVINALSGKNTVSDLSVKNTAGVQGIARAIFDEARQSPEGPMITLTNLSIEVSGGTDNTGIEVGHGAMGNRPTLKNIDVTIVGGRLPRGISSRSAAASKVNVNIVGGPESEQTIGWTEFTSGLGFNPIPTVITDFHVSVRGGTEPQGMHFFAGAESITVSDGQIQVSDIDSQSAGIGIWTLATHEGQPNQFSNVEINAATGIAHQGGGLVLSDVIVSDSTALEAATVSGGVVNAPAVVEVRRSTLMGKTLGIGLTTNHDIELIIDNSSISGGINAILGLPGGDIRIGSSKVIGPIDAGGGSIVCVFVHDEQYVPVTCP